MILQKRRIRNLSPYIRHIKDGAKIVVGISDPARFTDILRRIGFVEPIEKGQSILPTGIGPISVYNAEGKEIVHRDQSMETAYRQVEWHWEEWHGPYERVPQSKIVDVPYKRYPRSLDEPPAIELTINVNTSEQLLLVSPPFEKTEANKKILTHVVNLFLELFHECEFFTSNLDSIIKAPLRRLNWTILAQGEMPWEQLKDHVEPIVKSAPEGNQRILFYRIKTVNALKPDFRAVGHGGFHGYIVHGFTPKNLYVLESMYYGNATYVFGETWEELSQKTKAEILNEKLQKARVIHRGGWKRAIEDIVQKGGHV